MNKELKRNLKASVKPLTTFIIVALLILSTTLLTFTSVVRGISGTVYVITPTTGTSDATQEANGRKLARTSNGTLLVAYQKIYGTFRNIYVNRSFDNGTTWKAGVRITGYGVNCQGVNILVNETDAVWVIYECNDGVNEYIRCNISTNLGASFGAVITIAQMTTGKYQRYPNAFVDNKDNIHVTWAGVRSTGESTRFARYRQYNASTATWGNIINVSDNVASDIEPPSVVAYDNTVIIVWGGTYSSRFNLKYSKSTNKGVTFSAPANITTQSAWTGGSYPSLALNSTNGVYCAYHAGYLSGSFGYNIAITKYNGATWTTPVNITTGHVAVTNDSQKPSISINSDSTIYVTYKHRYTGASYFYIRSKNSTDSGATWGTVTTFTPGASSTQDISSSLEYKYPLNQQRLSAGLMFVWVNGSGTFPLQFFRSSDYSFAPPSPPELPSNYTIKGIYSNKIDWAGLNGTNVWSNSSGDHYETMEINMSVNASQNVTTINVWVADLRINATANYIRGGNISMQVSSDNITWGSNVRAFTNLGSNLTINKTLWTTGNGCYGTNPFNGAGITDRNTSIYVRFRLTIPNTATTGIYYYQTLWKVYIGRTT